MARKHKYRSALAASAVDRSPIRPLSLMIGAWLLTSCGTDVPARHTVRDSAGVAIIENVPGMQAFEALSLDSLPRLSIGGNEDDSTTQFHGVVGLTRLSNGTIVVGDGSSRTIRFFRPDGQLLALAGGVGEGPGRFRELSRLWRDEYDSVFVYDQHLGRLSVFDAAGRYADSRSLGMSGRRPILLGPLGADRLLGYWRMAFDYRAQATGEVRDSVYLVIIDRARLQAVDSIGPLPASEFVIVTAEKGLSVAPRAFSRALRTAVGSDQLAVSSQDTFQIKLYSPTGALRRSVRLARPNPDVTSADVSQYRSEWMADIRNDQQSTVAGQLLSVMTYPRTWPAHGAIEFDAAGYLWVRNSTTYRDAQPEWEVFDQTGVWRQTVTVPPRFGIFEIGHDYVLGRWRDANDVEFVRLYGLRRQD